MTPDQLRAAITFANGIDPRVQMTAPNAELWGRVLGHKDAAEVKAAILLYSERYPAGGLQNPSITPAHIKRIIHDESARAEAVTEARSLNGRKLIEDPNTYRERNREMWDRLVKQGRDDHRAGLRARGITPHVEGCMDCAAELKRAERKTEMRDAA